MPTTDNSISTRAKMVKARILAQHAKSNPIKLSKDQSNKTYEATSQGNKSHIIQPPVGATVVSRY
jgi:hypothetical protein